jgi:hypothetical protein
MGSENGFCIDCSIGSGSHWHAEKCWDNKSNFENDNCHDDAKVVLEPGVVDRLTLCIQCSGGDLLTDRIQLYDLHD